MNKESAVKNISDMLISGKVAPWKLESGTGFLHVSNISVFQPDL